MQSRLDHVRGRRHTYMCNNSYDQIMKCLFQRSLELSRAAFGNTIRVQHHFVLVQFYVSNKDRTMLVCTRVKFPNVAKKASPKYNPSLLKFPSAWNFNHQSSCTQLLLHHTITGWYVARDRYLDIAFFMDRSCRKHSRHWSTTLTLVLFSFLIFFRSLYKRAIGSDIIERCHLRVRLSQEKK